MSSSCCFLSISVSPVKQTLFSSVHCPSKSLILQPLKPLKFPSLHRTIITFQKFPTGFIPPQSASSCPSSSVDLQPIEELPPKLQEIVKLFQSVQQSRTRYDQVISYGNNLKPLDPQFKTSENKVKGCASQIWIRAFFDKQRNVVYEADSDAIFMKGLAAILVWGLSGRPMPEIVRIRPDFGVLGLQQSVSPRRNNGFVNMLNLMKKKARDLEAGEKDSSSGESSESTFVSIPENKVEVSVPEVDLEFKPNLVEDSGAEKIEDSQRGSIGVALGCRGIRIREKLEKVLNPFELEVEDVSYQHAGHTGGDDGETHFKLRIVSDAFQGKSLIKKHRLLYDLLHEELQSG